jgi:hypothetical protein
LSTSRPRNHLKATFLDPDQQIGWDRDTADPQLKVFIEEATKKTKTEVSGLIQPSKNIIKSTGEHTKSTAR